MHSATARKFILLLAAIPALCGCGSRGATPPAPAQGSGGGGSAPAASADAERLIADTLATARDINTLMRTVQQQAAAADSPTAAVTANQSQITALEERAQKLHDDIMASGRFDAGVPPELVQKYAADLEKEVNLSMELTRKGVQARSFETSVLTNAALNLNAILTVLRQRSGSSGAAPAGSTAGSDTASAGTGGAGATSVNTGSNGGSAAAGGGTSGTGGAGGSSAAGSSGSAGSAQNYDGPAAVEPTGRAVSADTELSAGMLVLVEYNQSWYAADVLSVKGDGTVRIHYRGWEAAWDEDVPRSRLQLAH